jgi:UDP:flavonoid glycosyltransferase YjiC (YdhE family)
MFSPFGTLGWFSPLLAAPQPDWPVHTQITGFPIYDKRTPGEGLDPELEEFLRNGDPPVVFTLGSSAVVDAGSFYEQSREAIRRLGCRAVFLMGDQNHFRNGAMGSEDVFYTDYAPYSLLFARAAAVVHQGGIGTVAQTMHAGVPSLVVPRGLDQPDNAFRVRSLGIARVLSRSRYNAARAASNIKALLANPDYARSARAVGLAERGEDGVAAACTVLETVCCQKQHA